MEADENYDSPRVSGYPWIARFLTVRESWHVYPAHSLHGIWILPNLCRVRNNQNTMTYKIYSRISTVRNRREFIVSAGLVAGGFNLQRAAATGAPTIAQKTPSLRIIVPLLAGSAADTSARLLAEQWTRITGRAVVIDNRPGGNYQIGMQQLLSAPADGNACIHLNPGLSATQVAFNQFDLTKQIVAGGIFSGTPGGIFVPFNSPVESSKELIEWMRANPGKANFGAISGGLEHMTTVGMLKRSGVSATLISYKGGPDVFMALAQGELQFAIGSLPNLIQFKGRVRPLAILTGERSAIAPSAPTYLEAGLDSPALDYWGGLAFKAGTPEAVVASFNRTLLEVVQSPTLVEKLAIQGIRVKASTPVAMTATIAEEVKWMKPISAELNLKTN